MSSRPRAAPLALLALLPLLAACSREEPPETVAVLETAPAPAGREVEPLEPERVPLATEPELAEPGPREDPAVHRGTPELPAQAILTGFVFDHEGREVRNAAVLLVARADAQVPYARVQGTRTDREGTFRIAVDAPAEGLLLVAADGLVPHAEPVHRREAGEHELGAIPLEEGAVLEGVAHGCGPRGFVHASLQATYLRTDYVDVSDIAWIDGRPVRTYVYGRTEGESFRFAGLERGAWRVGARKALLGGECRVHEAEVQEQWVEVPSAGVELYDHDPLARFEVLSGGAPLAGARVGPVGKSPCTTSSLGTVYWRLVPGESYRFRIEAEGHVPVELDVEAPPPGEIAQVPVELERP
jgi:hypothetical protein